MSPIQVDFYIAPTAKIERLLWILLEKSRAQSFITWIYCVDEQRLLTLDEQLWRFKPTSFMPHALWHEWPDHTIPIRLGLTNQACEGTTLFINLTSTLPSPNATLERIIEVIPADDPTLKTEGRQRYRYYQHDDRYHLKQPIVISTAAS